MPGFVSILLTIVSVMPATPGPVSAVTIEGRSVNGIFSGADAEGVTLTEATRSRRLLYPELMSLKWLPAAPTTAPASQPGLARLDLFGGGRFDAQFVGADSKHLYLETRVAGRLELPLTQVAGIRFSTGGPPSMRVQFEAALASPESTEDTLFSFREGKLTPIRGVAEAIRPDGVTFRWRNRSVNLKPDSIYGLVFARGVERRPPPEALCILRDDSALNGRVTGGNADSVSLELRAGPVVRLPLESIREIRFRSDRVLFLSDIPPTSYEFDPLLGTRWTYRPDRSAAGRPIRLGAQVFERGIGLHSQSRLNYELPDRYTQLAAIIGIDDDVRPLGHVVFRVVADGKEVFNSGPVTGRDPPRPILVELAGARKLQLAVDFGEDLDIGDHADWANIRLIK